MAKTINGRAELLHDAKRVYVYIYSSDKNNMDGKITISKKILGDSEIDFVDALENRDIEIENASSCKSKLYLPPVEVDELALSLLGEIINEYETKGTMPQAVGE